MALIAEKEYELIGQSRGCEDHDFDLVRELTRRLDALWRYDQHIANASQKPELQQLWRDLKQHDLAVVKHLKALIAAEIEAGCF